MIVTLIDVNDNHPVFESAQYQVTISEHTLLKTTPIHLYVRTTENAISIKQKARLE